MSKVQVKIQRAREKGYGLIHFSKEEEKHYGSHVVKAGYHVFHILGDIDMDGPHSKRQAANLAYKLSLGK